MHMDRLNALLATARQRNQWHACQMSKLACACPFVSIHQRRLRDRSGQRQPQQEIVRTAFTDMEGTRGAFLCAKRGHLHDAPHAALKAGGKQRLGSQSMYRRKCLHARFANNSGRVNDAVNSVEPRDPVRRILLAAEICCDIPGMLPSASACFRGRITDCANDLVPGLDELAHDGAAEKAARASQQHRGHARPLTWQWNNGAPGAVATDSPGDKR